MSLICSMLLVSTPNWLSLCITRLPIMSCPAPPAACAEKPCLAHRIAALPAAPETASVISSMKRGSPPGGISVTGRFQTVKGENPTEVYSKVTAVSPDFPCWDSIGASGKFLAWRCHTVRAFEQNTRSHLRREVRAAAGNRGLHGRLRRRNKCDARKVTVHEPLPIETCSQARLQIQEHLY